MKKFFNINKITTHSEDMANSLRQTRIDKNIKIEEVAKKLGINVKYLEALENNEPGKLPEGVYGKNFLREYAKFLGINPKDVVDLYGIENEKKDYIKKGLFVQKVPGVQYFLSLPKLITGTIVIVMVLVCIGYLGICVKKIVSPPSLSVTNPMSDLTIEKNSIDIQGITEPEAEVTINGESVLTDPSGYFMKKVNLKNGLNTISITAQKKYSRKNNIEKKILVRS